MWKKGRQHTGYDVFTLWSKFNVDMHIIRYNDGNYIPPHTDKVEGKRHYRINVVLKKPVNGGQYVGDSIWNWKNRVIFFRPDIHEHSITACTGGRLVLSVGWTRHAAEADQMAAVQQDGWAIRHIKNPSIEVQLAAVQQNGHAIKYITNPSTEVSICAIESILVDVLVVEKSHRMLIENIMIST